MMTLSSTLVIDYTVKPSLLPSKKSPTGLSSEKPKPFLVLFMPPYGKEECGLYGTTFVGQLIGLCARKEVWLLIVRDYIVL